MDDELTPIGKVRAEVDRETSAIFPSMRGLERDCQVAVRTLERVDGRTITIELAINMLKASEKFYRELANQELADMSPDKGVSVYFDIWSELDDALKGAIGQGPIAPTIEYLRRRASSRRKFAKMGGEILRGDSPLQLKDTKELFDSVLQMGKSVSIYRKAAENYDTAARLFENRVNFQDIET